jgi:hypothetical protein
MKDRLLKKGMVTTILGVVCMGGAIYMHVSKEFTSIEAGELAAIGLIFLRSKDSLINIGAKS